MSRSSSLRRTSKARPWARGRWVWLLWALLLLLAFPSPGEAELTPHDRAQALLARLSPTEKVGQLFLVTFSGADPTEDEAIYRWIVQRRIGGVVLRMDQDNFAPPPQTLPTLQATLNRLQNWAYPESDEQLSDPATGERLTPNFIPLWIALQQEGDSVPGDALPWGLTPLPSPMALGATWDPNLAQETGAVLGQELSALGVNLLFGPPLEVLETATLGSPGDLSVRSFGSHPFWVARMAQAYLVGVHQGSRGRVAFVGRYFPGYGGTLRPLAEEIPTVRKPWDEMRETTLAPFVRVMAAEPPARVDALLVGHIRYLALQGNIRPTTPPVSLDAKALQQVLEDPTVRAWYEAQGVLISDDLGSPALHRYAGTLGQVYEPQRLAREAFLAGNHLLYLGPGFVDPRAEEPSYIATVDAVLDFFVRKYLDDPAFAQRVDDAVLRLLTLKFQLYGEFSLSAAQRPRGALETIGQGREITFQVAQRAATLLDPSLLDLPDVLPAPPGRADRLLFIIDTYTYRLCSECPEKSVPAPEDFRQAVLRLYGPRAQGLVLPENLQVFTARDLAHWLAAPYADPNRPLNEALSQADWVIFVVLDPSDRRVGGRAIPQLLEEAPERLRNKKVVVFAMQAPYALGAGHLANVTAYYGMYGKTLPFVDLAVRLLFQEALPQGASPVSVPEIGYDIMRVTQPDPEQKIHLTLEVIAGGQATPTPPPAGEPWRLPKGQLVAVHTGVITDYNGHPVPDGTPVRFVLALVGSDTVLQRTEVSTQDGRARGSLVLDTAGLVEIRAQAGEARSEALRVEVLGAPPTPLQPTPTRTAAPSPTATLAAPQPEAARPSSWRWRVGLILWAGLWAGLLGFAGSAWARRRGSAAPWPARYGWAVFGAAWLGYLVGYILQRWRPDQGGAVYVQSLGFLLGGALLGWLAAQIWQQRLS
ncbi:MAG: hypothetical protein GXO37_01130 [Chloroflexi bacterium]|nr:hypothetical protein [Chloroflexota bacterium]